MRFSRHNFSIVELLVVIGIAAVLMGLALPGFNHMINGDKVTASARQLSGAIAHARSEAILSGRNVALLLPMVGVPGIKDNYLNRSYAVVRLSRTDANKMDMVDFANLKWEYLSKGVILSGLVKAESGTKINEEKWLDDELGKTLFDLSDDKQLLRKIDGLVISSSGTTAAKTWKNLQSNNDVKDLLEVISGHYTVSEDGIPIRKRNLGKNNDDCILAIRFKPDGTVDTNGNLHLHITEGISDDAKLVATRKTDAATRPGNTIHLLLNQYTGRCRFIMDENKSEDK